MESSQRYMASLGNKEFNHYHYISVSGALIGEIVHIYNNYVNFKAQKHVCSGTVPVDKLF